MPSFTNSISLHFFHLALKSMANSIHPVQFPVGFRFCPTDEELLHDYLRNKIFLDEYVDYIPEIDMYKNEPWDLPELLKNDTGMKEWLFFSALDFKHSKNRRFRCNRTTKTGFWKPTGNDRKIMARGTKNLIGIKKTLVFYYGQSSDGNRTNWVIHEYHLRPDTEFAKLRPLVICRLKKNSDENVSKFDKPNGLVNSTFENGITVSGIQEALKSPGQPALPDSQLTNRQSIQPEATARPSHYVLQGGNVSRDTSDDETFVGQNIPRRSSPTEKHFQNRGENELQSGSTGEILFIILFFLSSFMAGFLFVSMIVQVSMYVLRLISRDNRLTLLIITLLLFQPLIVIV